MKQGILYIIIASLLVTLFLGSTTAGATSIQAVTENASKQASFFWEEDFSAALPSGTYFITASDGSGLVDNGSFKLTEDVSLEHGRIFLRAPALMNQFIATYRVNLGSKDGTGADGIAFIFCPVYNYSPDVGGTLDATCPGGYMVALDTFEENESFPDYIYIAHDSFANRLNIVESPIDLEDGAWHDVAVYFDQGSITVMLDGNAVISEFAIPGYTPFLGYFGFGAATGMYSNDQRVDDIQVQVPRFWEEDFSTVLPSNSYFISASDGSGLVDNGSFKLTEDVSLEHGRIFLRAPALMNQFIATYRVNLGSKDWTGADGIAFIFCPVYDYPAETGGSFDAICPGGYMVALDTMEYYDSYPDFIHIAHDSYANILHSVQAPINLEDGAWHDVAVYFDQGIITVMLDGNAVISGFAIPGYVPFQGYFGFSAATGMYSNEQRVDDIQVQVKLPFSAWDEVFSSALLPGTYFITASDGSGLVDSGSFKLTENVSLESGRIFHRAPVLMDQFTATYRVNLGSKDWTGADGIAFIFCPVYDYSPDVGGTLDATCPGGYMVALDTMEHYDSYPDFIHIAHDSYANILHSVQAPINLEDGAWHDVAVFFDQGSITVMLDGNAVISEFAIPGYVPFLGSFGFSAATGMYSNDQRVDDLQIKLDIQKIFLPVVTR